MFDFKVLHDCIGCIYSESEDAGLLTMRVAPDMLSQEDRDFVNARPDLDKVVDNLNKTCSQVTLMVSIPHGRSGWERRGMGRSGRDGNLEWEWPWVGQGVRGTWIGNGHE